MKRLIFFSLLLLAMCGCMTAQNNAGPTLPKHEFRGAWMHIIGQGQYARMTPEETRDYLIKQLDLLQRANCNAVIWQIRPQADAAYVSDLEPWSRWLTGEPGKAPNPVWDPLQSMIEQTHRRGMELHAWINPYRVTSSEEDKPAAGHIYYEHPEWFLKYADGKLYFDPGLPESRDFIDKVVRDILTRYDIDALHMDDYFYPYPIKDAVFPDTTSYNEYGIGWDKDDWRRHNVDLLIEQLHNTIQEVKPWVRFGISPFGIWRNKASDPDGSETNGLQCYDALYADCLKWTAEGWVDYMVPQ
ncbi:MAG: family 10 glycosylhydrolase, partial [Muribaculaceae bacterium]|nr:family 10 glycosylhydrolase [Muribaculaceae bacterium]